MNASFPSEDLSMNIRQAWPRRAAAAALSLFLLGLLGGCSSQNGGQAFNDPNTALTTMVTALRSNDTAQLSKLLGPKANEVLASGDQVADSNAKADFLAKYDQKHQLVPSEDGQSMTLEVGDTDWPMPIPIVKDPDGWRFDTEAGLDEMLSRRIGHNELSTIETCRAIDDAQAEYLSMNPRNSPTPEYARKFLSTPGTKDGLFWRTAEGETPSPLGEIAAEAAAEGYSAAKGTAYHGYHYRMLTSQGQFAPGGKMSYLTGDQLTKGFGAVAYPAQYGNSGIMTFIVDRQGVVYQKDLGPQTASIASVMDEFNPDPSWTLAK
jgi:hypothetical protein